VKETSLKAQQSAATREEIINACLRLFAYRGFHITSIAEIARHAGITKGAIYWHFDNKEALFAAILEKIKYDWQRIVRQQVDEIADPRLKLEQLFNNYLLLFTEQPEVCLFLQRGLFRGADDKYAQLISGAFERTARFIARIIEQGKTTGVFRSDLDATLLAYTIIGSLAGATGQCHANKKLKLGTMVDEIKRQVLARSLAAT
jgi:TetR/AcrR family acrAB operon transcriptional repressor